MKNGSKCALLLFAVGFISTVILSEIWSNANLDFVSPLQQIQAASNVRIPHVAFNLTSDEINVPFDGLKHAQDGEVEKRQDERVRTVVNNTMLNSRLPQRPLEVRKNEDERILVVYSGPTDVMDPEMPLSDYRQGHKKIVLYRLNFEFFLEHGIQCQTQDTILVLTELVASAYRSRIEMLHQQCQQEHGNSVILATRNNTCLDLESIRVALYGGYVNVSSYDYFVYLNCGVTGPSPQWAKLPWTHVFLSKLNDEIKMTGLSMNCRSFNPHIQSMMYALDRTALEIVMEGGAIFNCKNDSKLSSNNMKRKSAMHSEIVKGYEIRMSQLILEKGYGISPILRPFVIFSHNKGECREGITGQKDLWMTARLEDYFGKVPSLDELIFFKTSRVLTNETAEQINFTFKVDWNW